MMWSRLFLLTLFCGITSSVTAQDSFSSKDIDNHRIHFSVFNSSFLPPKAASAYGFVRAKDRAILNIAVTDKNAGGESRGLPVRLTGSATNLLQQKTNFDFIEIDEGDAVYYLAEFKISNKEAMNFTIHVLLPGKRYSDTITFSKTLYHD